MAAWIAASSQWRTTPSFTERFAASLSVRTLPSIFSMVVMSWSRALMTTT